MFRLYKFNTRGFLLTNVIQILINETTAGMSTKFTNNRACRSIIVSFQKSVNIQLKIQPLTNKKDHRIVKE